MHNRKQEESSLWSFAGAGVAGASQILIFHPYDTIAKRLQKNELKINNFAICKKVVFKDAAELSVANKISSLYAGTAQAGMYKVAQCVLKFGGQPIIHEHMNHSLSESTKQILGDVGQRALAGGFAGISELTILPFDTLKVRRQNGTYTEKGFRNLCKYVYAEKFKLWNGGLTTAARNFPGSFLLFGGEAATRQYVFGIDNPKKATLFQNIFAASIGSLASVVGTLPMDVVKTRIQSPDEAKDVKALQIIKKMWVQGGVGSFFKGLLPKTAIAAPKVAFTLVAAPYITDSFIKMSK